MTNGIRLRLAALLALAILCLASSSSWSATALRVRVPWDRTYLYWLDDFALSASAEKPVAFADWEKEQARYDSFRVPKRFKGKSATLEAPDSGKAGEKSALRSATLVVYDVSTGNEAVETIGFPVDPKGLALKPRDFDEARRVQIKITAQDKPLESARVEFTDIAGRTQTAIVDPGTVGVVEFLDVTVGDATVKVFYGDGKTASQDITIPEERDAPVYFTEVPVAGPADTVEEAAGGAEQKAKAAKHEARRESGAEWTATLIGSLVGIIVLAVIVVVVILVLRSRGVTLDSSLRKLGVQLPEEVSPDAPTGEQPAVQLDPNICQFCGQRKDPQTGQCACSVAPQPAAAPAGSGPRLIGVQGSYAMNIFELKSDVTTIGREPDNVIALPDDTTVSRHHARITLENGIHMITDAGSSNGVFVNGEKTTEWALQPGDEIQVGTTKFRFEV